MRPPSDGAAAAAHPAADDRRRRMCLWLMPSVAIAGCAAPVADGPPTLPEGLRVNLVTARGISASRAPMGVADYFGLDGTVVAYASFTWTDLDQAWGAQTVVFHWYNADRLIRRQSLIVHFGRPPHQVWSYSQPVTMGEGNCRVELHWHDRKLAERAFRVVDMTGPPRTRSGTGT